MAAVDEQDRLSRALQLEFQLHAVDSCPLHRFAPVHANIRIPFAWAMALSTDACCCPGVGRRLSARHPGSGQADGREPRWVPVPQATFDYLAGLEWIRAKENSLLGARGHWEVASTDRSRLRGGGGQPARPLLLRCRLGRDPLPGLADNSVGRVIDSVLRADLVLLDELGCAPRGADVPCGMRGPPPTFAAVGRS
jgi:hypothetical protein